MSEEKQSEQPQPQEDPHVTVAEPCGGPLVCINCAARYAQAYFNAGRGVWADYYYRHAIKLKNEAEIGRLQQENNKLALANSQLEKEMWKVYTNSNGTS